MLSRLSQLRSPVKVHAGADAAGFMLGTGQRCVARVASLMKENQYLFPGKWDQDVCLIFLVSMSTLETVLLDLDT